MELGLLVSRVVFNALSIGSGHVLCGGGLAVCETGRHFLG